MAAKRKPDSVVRCFEVSTPTLHEKGHTIYKITQKVNLIHWFEAGREDKVSTNNAETPKYMLRFFCHINIS